MAYKNNDIVQIQSGDLPDNLNTESIIDFLDVDDETSLKFENVFARLKAPSILSALSPEDSLAIIKMGYFNSFPASVMRFTGTTQLQFDNHLRDLWLFGKDLAQLVLTSIVYKNAMHGDVASLKMAFEYNGLLEQSANININISEAPKTFDIKKISNISLTEKGNFKNE